MSLHRSCCPCGDCYDGVLCEPCLSPCVDVAQPAATVQISEREWLNHIDDLPGTGSGAVIFVNGAWYFFDGTTSACSARASTIDWSISYRADDCPDFGVSLNIIVPFTGGFDFTVGWTAFAEIGGITDPLGCVQNAWNNDFPGSAPLVLSAGDPNYVGWSMTAECAASDPVSAIYGTGLSTDYSYAGDGSLTACSFPNDFFGHTGTCNTTEFVSQVSIEAWFFADEVTPDTAEDFTAEAFRFVQTCSTGSYGIEIENIDADGYFKITVESTCVIRFIGPVEAFANAFNATFAGTGVECEVLDPNWFLGSKVRAAYVGTAYQASFPYAAVSPTSFSLTSLGDDQAITVSDVAYDRLHGIASFNGSVEVVTDAPFSGTICAPGCGGTFLPANTGFDAYGTHPSGSGNQVRERYGVTLHPSTWTWNEETTPGDPCEPTSTSWAVI